MWSRRGWREDHCGKVGEAGRVRLLGMHLAYRVARATPGASVSFLCDRNGVSLRLAEISIIAW